MGGDSAGGGRTGRLALRRGLALPGCVVFEVEAIDYWRFREGDGYAPLYDQWLKVAREIAGNGVPVVMLGIATPAQLDASSQRMFFSTISVLGLVCDESTQAARLRARPAWRRAADPAFIEEACAFTRSLREQASLLGMPLVNTGTLPLDDTVSQVAAWVRQRDLTSPS